MTRTKFETIQMVLNRLRNNRETCFSVEDYKAFQGTVPDDWFEVVIRTTVLCPHCRRAHVTIPDMGSLAICTNCTEIVEISDADRTCYRFKMNALFADLQSNLGLVRGTVPSARGIHFLGKRKFSDDEWQVWFSSSRLLTKSFGNVFEAQLQWTAPFTLLLVDQIPDLSDAYLSALACSGIYLILWHDACEASVEELYSQEEDDFQLRRTLYHLNLQSNPNLFVSTLRQAATTAQGDTFEEEIYGINMWAFQKVIPFGGQYKGFAVPDGLIANIRPHQKTAILFYDCKSFTGDRYKPKAEISMQANYYQDFLEDFFNQGNYDNAGFIIFSSAFPKEVQDSIMGSAQWKYVQSRCTVFYIDVESMEQLDDLTTRYGYEFDRQVFFDICFTGDLKGLGNDAVAQMYADRFPASAYTGFRFLAGEQIIVAFIAACITQYQRVRQDGLAALDEGLEPLMLQAKHDEMKRKNIANPTVPVFLQDYVQAVRQKNGDAFLNPLARLLILKRLRRLAVDAFGHDQYVGELEHVEAMLNTVNQREGV